MFRLNEGFDHEFGDKTYLELKSRVELSCLFMAGQGPWPLILEPLRPDVPASRFNLPPSSLILAPWSWSFMLDPWSLILNPWSLYPWTLILDPWSLIWSLIRDLRSLIYLAVCRYMSLYAAICRDMSLYVALCRNMSVYVLASELVENSFSVWAGTECLTSW